MPRCHIWSSIHTYIGDIEYIYVYVFDFVDGEDIKSVRNLPPLVPPTVLAVPPPPLSLYKLVDKSLAKCWLKFLILHHNLSLVVTRTLLYKYIYDRYRFSFQIRFKSFQGGGAF